MILRAAARKVTKIKAASSGPEAFWGVQGRKATRGSSGDQNTDFAIASKSQ
jgi:hypothetical protein